MHDDQLIEDLLRDPLDLGWYRIANAPIRYRAFELGEIRFAWTVPPFLRPVHAGPMLPAHYALTLRLSPMGHWRVESLKPFEWAVDAERWARALWRDATRRARPGR
jgi:hypothetical protein